MNPSSCRLACRLLIGVTLALACIAAPGQAQVKKKNPASKVFVSDVSGEAEIDTGDSVEDLSKRSVYTAQGSVIDTKRPKNNEDRSKYYSTMVYSNGTGAFFDADTRVEIRRFIQEPFVPTRTDNEVEPSISQTHAHVARGVVGLCASKLVAGSTMTYTTPHAAVNIHGRKLVIDVRPDQTRVSVLEGESTIRAGSMDMGGHTVRAGQQAIIRPGAPGQPNQIEVVKIPPAEAGGLDDKVSMACMAKRTVYFEVRGRQQSQGSNDGTIDAFNSEINTPRVPGGPFIGADGEIIAVPIVPPNLPVQHTVSPSSLITPNGQVVTPGNPKG